jgi:saccharopine dehydrogenase (NAD+, L-lysine-forming)
MPEKMVRLVRLVGTFKGILALRPVQAFLKWLVKVWVKGPDEQTRASAFAEVWGTAWDDSGDRVACTLTLPEGYTHTAQAVLEITQRIRRGDVDAGAHTPSSAFGPRFVEELPNAVFGELSQDRLTG